MQPAGLAEFQVFDYLGLGVLVCSPEGLTIRFVNDRAKTWFGAELAGKSLTAIIPLLNGKEVAERLAKGESFTLSGEIAPPSSRRVAFSLTISPKRLGPDQLLVAEIQDITKVKEQQHLLQSFSRMVERKSREIEKERERAESS